MDAHPLSIDSLLFVPSLWMLMFSTLAVVGGATVLDYVVPCVSTGCRS
ncbi:hypothetical protein [Cognatazoarcus halotolerans]|nr:hypothetical protein [Cognatazoarcus halotolerans]MCP5307783.1 hypothetical protein [Zoogloeaceae bacterium]